MTGIYIVPDALRDALNQRLDEAFKDFPDAEKDREFLYGQLLEAFAKYGKIPEFTLEPTTPGTEP